MTDKEEGAAGPREAAYDEHVFPLMAKLIEVCRAHDLPMFAAFDISDVEPGFCVTNIPTREGEDRLRPLLDTYYARIKPPPALMAFTIVQTPKVSP
jgi:hypothetical protein